MGQWPEMSQLFMRQPQTMVKHTQTIRRQIALKRLDQKGEKVHGEKIWPIVMKYERNLCEGVDSDSIKNFHSEVFCINWKTPAI